jgi:hypothetical protein
MMHNFTESQLAVLSHAAQRDDGAVNLTDSLKGGAAAKVGKALIARKLMREVRAKPGMPVWRRDAEGRQFSLVISSAGRKAVGVVRGPVESATGVRDRAKASSGATANDRPSARIRPRLMSNPQDGGQPRAPTPSSTSSARAGTKKAQLIEMLSRSAGASIDALMGATGWLPHTTRAALTGLRHAGYSIERSKRDDGVSVYRVLHPLASRESANAVADRA